MYSSLVGLCNKTFHSWRKAANFGRRRHFPSTCTGLGKCFIVFCQNVYIHVLSTENVVRIQEKSVYGIYKSKFSISDNNSRFGDTLYYCRFSGFTKCLSVIRLLLPGHKNQANLYCFLLLPCYSTDITQWHIKSIGLVC